MTPFFVFCCVSSNPNGSSIYLFQEQLVTDRTDEREAKSCGTGREHGQTVGDRWVRWGIEPVHGGGVRSEDEHVDVCRTDEAPWRWGRLWRHTDTVSGLKIKGGESLLHTSAIALTLNPCFYKGKVPSYLFHLPDPTRGRVHPSASQSQAPRFHHAC